MCLIKFYYFNFLFYFKRKGVKQWEAELRSLLLFGMTLAFGAYCGVYILNNFFQFSFMLLAESKFNRLFFSATLLLILYVILVKDNKSDIIYQQFINHHFNTKRNRLICWLIFIIIVFVPVIIAAIKKYYFPN